MTGRPTKPRNKKTPPVVGPTDGAQPPEGDRNIMTIVTAQLTGTRLLASLTSEPHYEAAQPVPTSPCPAWCTSTHRPALAPNTLYRARAHEGDFYMLPLITGEGPLTETGHRPAALSLHLEQLTNSREPRIVLRENSRRAGAQYDGDGALHGCPTWLSPEEALVLARALVALVDVAHGLTDAPSTEEADR